MDTADTDEKLFRRVRHGHGARVLPLELVPVPGAVPKFVLGQQQKAMFRLVPVPGDLPRAPSMDGA